MTRKHLPLIEIAETLIEVTLALFLASVVVLLFVDAVVPYPAPFAFAADLVLATSCLLVVSLFMRSLRFVRLP